MRSMNIPKFIRLPWRSPIAIVQVTRAEMKGILNAKAEEEVADGCWDVEVNKIYLVTDDIPISRIRYTLYHEIGHAWNDAFDALLDSWNISEREPHRTWIKDGTCPDVIKEKIDGISPTQ